MVQKLTELPMSKLKSMKILHDNASLHMGKVTVIGDKAHLFVVDLFYSYRKRFRDVGVVEYEHDWGMQGRAIIYILPSFIIIIAHILKTIKLPDFINTILFYLRSTISRSHIG